MNNEIKEILDKIKSVSNFDDYVDFVGTEFKPLLDYITNLQERNKKAIEFIENLWKENSWYEDVDNCMQYLNLDEFNKSDLLDILKGESI